MENSVSSCFENVSEDLTTEDSFIEDPPLLWRLNFLMLLLNPWLPFEAGILGIVDKIFPDSELLDLHLVRELVEELDIKLSITLVLKMDVDPFGRIFDNLLFGTVEFEVATGKQGAMEVGWSVIGLLVDGS